MTGKQRTGSKGLRIRAWLLAASVLTVFCAGKPASAFAQAADPMAPAEAKALLMRMAEYLAKAPRFSVSVIDSYDVTQESGEKIEFGETRKILLARPDRLRVEVNESDGENHALIYDGKNLTMATASQNVYARTDKPGTTDDAIVYFVRDLGMKLPLAALLVTTAPSELEKRTQSIRYVEKTSILGAPAHHLACRTGSVDYQVWIADGDRPLPMRIVLTYRKDEGQPQFRALLTDWDFSPETNASLFTYVPPADANKIAFLAKQPPNAEPPAAQNNPESVSANAGGVQ